MILVKPSFTIETPIDAPLVLRQIEKAGRTCYKSEPKYKSKDVNEIFESTKAFIAVLIKRGHHSVLEHQSLTVRFICDRGVTHELVRHRLAAFSQESTRYCDYSNGHVMFILPPWVKIEPGVHDIRFLPAVKDPAGWSQPDWRWFMSMAQAEHDYKYLIDQGWSPQEARSVLPNSLKTEIVMTCNLREWRHVLSLRAVGTAGRPHPQMVEIMQPLLHELQRIIPVIFDDLIVGEPHA